jgi:16S rRNA (uracil1498-N3)-methyltransferase
MRRVVFNQALAAGHAAKLDQSQQHYLFDVLRMRPGQMFVAIAPQGIAFIAALEPRSEGTCTILELAGEAGREPELAVDLFVPLLKGDKLDLVVQKSVELGVSQINLFSAERSVVKPSGNTEKKLTRLQKIANDATQQCGRHKVPLVHGIFNLADVALKRGVFAWEQETRLSLADYLQQHPPSGRLALLTGPEGGLTPGEALILLESGWKSVSLGPRILRAETAALTVLACTMFACGEMG